MTDEPHASFFSFWCLTMRCFIYNFFLKISLYSEKQVFKALTFKLDFFHKIFPPKTKNDKNYSRRLNLKTIRKSELSPIFLIFVKIQTKNLHQIWFQQKSLFCFKDPKLKRRRFGTFFSVKFGVGFGWN